MDLFAAAATTPSSPIATSPADPWSFLHELVDHLRASAPVWAPIAVPLLTLTVVGLLTLRRRLRRRYQQRLTTGARLVTVLAPPTVDPAGANALWANLLGLLRPGWRRLIGQPHLVWEYQFTADGIRIQIWVPGVVPDGFVERAVEAAWPGAHTRTIPARAPLPVRARPGRRILAAGGELCLARPEALPIRTDHDADPIRALLGAPGNLARNQRATVQILARPVTGRRVARSRQAARRLRTGGSAHLVGGLLDLLTPHTSRTRQRRRTATTTVKTDPQTSLAQSAEDRAIVTKQRGAPYEVRVRYAIAAILDEQTDETTTAQVTSQLRGRAHAIASAFAAYGEHNYYRRVRLRHPLPVLASRQFGHGDLLSVAELGALAHLPVDEATPGLQRAGAKAVAPPPGVSGPGPNVRPIGRTDAGHTRPVGLRVPDARHHLHVLGATGAGKSELLARMTLDDVAAHRGVVNVDPKGDQIIDILARYPLDALDRLVLFDAESNARPPCLNPLDQPDRQRAVDNLVSIFSRVYADSWGPRTEDIFRAGLLTLAAQPGVPVLTDLPKLLTDAAYRHRALGEINDDILAGFWTWYEALSEAARGHVVAPLMNKLRGFLLRPFVRAAIAAGPSTVDMDAVLNDGGVCLVRIAQDALGVETAALMGSIVVSAVWQATTRRARLPQGKRPDASLYLDEAHNFLTLPYALEDMLAAARGYRLGITLAHQNLVQLPRHLEESIGANARSKIYFTVSPADAKRLARHTEPRLAEHDLANLGVFHAAARLVVGGEEAPAFTVVTEKLPPPVPGRAVQIRRALRRRAAAPATPAPTGPRPQPTADPRRVP
ncbi:AAA-like domain-containing protein [Parafrankia irregularis]|uniref:AAA-like domain-containing protein n=1 Tax=Parafrankia irregularis TaxID=795642 RepID=A0A0S4QYU8_9ACTN|nr:MULTISPECIES: TraM recognition domain-containing protein [Parafrankia]MBE3200421.1 type IV secretory system conjugative DNA transfer family protein [Parafrankia sp. CH37]CUU60717.1 AAA-like domain-containing protein [Parafrankia irregularis]